MLNYLGLGVLGEERLGYKEYFIDLSNTAAFNSGVLLVLPSPLLTLHDITDTGLAILCLTHIVTLLYFLSKIKEQH